MSTPDLAAPRPRASQGVIHDLGYRHYDGPRRGRGEITRSLLLESTRAAYGPGRTARSKIMPMLLLGAICLPAVIIGVIAALTASDELPAEYTAYLLSVQPLVMIYVASQAPASVSRDLRFRVMPLYFSRPLRRIDYVMAKHAALSLAVFLFMALPLTILFVGALLAKLPLGEQLPDYLRSVGGAAVLALVLTGIALLIAAITPRRGLGIAAIIALLAVFAAVQGVVQEIAVSENNLTAANAAALISPFTLVHNVQHSLLGAENALLERSQEAVSGAVFAGGALLLIVGCFAALLLRYRNVSI